MEESKVRQLIDEVQARPMLWNKLLSEYKCKKAKGLEWSKIASILKVAKTTAQNKWRTLVSGFKDEHSRTQLHRSGDGLNDTYKSSWPYYESLLFLANSVIPYESSGNLDRLVNNAVISGASSVTDDNKFGLSSCTASLFTVKSENTMNKKQTVIDDSSAEMNDTAEQDKLNMSFFETLLPPLREISKQDIILCRNDISRVVFSYAYKDSNWKSLNDEKDTSRTNNRVGRAKKRTLYDDDADCQIINYVGPSVNFPLYNMPIKTEQKYRPTLRERNVERCNSENVVPRLRSDRLIHAYGPPGNYNNYQYNVNQPIPYQYPHGQHDFQQMENHMSRQYTRAATITHPYPETASRMLCQPMNQSHGNADEYLAISANNQSLITQNTANNHSSTTQHSANNPSLTTQHTACSETPVRPNINVINDARLFPATRDSLESNKENQTYLADTVNRSTPTDIVTGN